MDADLKTRFKWFRQTGATAREAIGFARVEIVAEQLNLTVEWESDVEADFGDHEFWCPGAARGKCPGHTVEYARVPDPENSKRSLSSIGGLIDIDNTYQRVIEAEVLSEAVDELATRYASNLPVTFAALA